MRLYPQMACPQCGQCIVEYSDPPVYDCASYGAGVFDCDFTYYLTAAVWFFKHRDL